MPTTGGHPSTLDHMTDDLIRQTVRAADTVRALEDQKQTAMRHRDDLIVACLDNGWTLTPLAREVDLSITYLKEIRKKARQT